MNKISKAFGSLKALDSVDFSAVHGEIHAILGENGAGKSTLMNLLYGLYCPDQGEIKLNRQRVQFKSSRGARRHGIAMVHQHFTLSPNLTVAENLALSCSKNKNPFFSPSKIKKWAQELADQHGLELDPSQKIEELSVGEQQRIEILKAIAQNCEILILDEPTSLLTLQEVAALFKMFRKLRENNKTIIFITHKVLEVKQLCDRATILKQGKVVETVVVSKTTEEELALKMVPKEGLFKPFKKDKKRSGKSWVELEKVTAKNNRNTVVLKDLSLKCYQGEVVSVVGVEGNGQKELVQVVRGRLKLDKGLRTCAVERIGYIPSNRQRDGLILPLSIRENFILEPYFLKECSSRGFLNHRRIERFAQHLIHHYSVATETDKKPVGFLSGGNQQKVVVGRELALKPQAVVAVNPTWGLDVESASYVYKQLLELNQQNVGILLVTIDLDEALKLSDRLYVLYKGVLTEIPTENWTSEKISLAMAGIS